MAPRDGLDSLARLLRRWPCLPPLTRPSGFCAPSRPSGSHACCQDSPLFSTSSVLSLLGGPVSAIVLENETAESAPGPEQLVRELAPAQSPREAQAAVDQRDEPERELPLRPDAARL